MHRLGNRNFATIHHTGFFRQTGQLPGHGELTSQQRRQRRRDRIVVCREILAIKLLCGIGHFRFPVVGERPPAAHCAQFGKQRAILRKYP
jgi:hypothetical protein